MICCNCWSCCLDLRAKVRLDDESIYSILFLVNKDANRRKEELSTQIDEMKALLERPAVITSQPSCDNRLILNNVLVNKSSHKWTIGHEMDQVAKKESFSTPFAGRVSSHLQSTPYSSKTPSFSHHLHQDTLLKKKQFAMSQSFSERIPSKASLPLLDNALLINADSREFLIMRLIEEHKYEDALEKSVQLVDMRRALVQEAQKCTVTEPKAVGTPEEVVEQSEFQLNRAIILLARCWMLLRRSEYSLKLLEDILLRQKQAKKINFDSYLDTLKLCVCIFEELKQPNSAIAYFQQQIHSLKEKFDVIDLQNVGKDTNFSSSVVGIAQVMHLLAEFSAENPDFLDVAITTYLDEIYIYERLQMSIDWRTLYRLGQLLAKRSEFLRAMTYFDLAIAVVLKLHGENFNPLGDIYHSKALCLWQLEELPQAILFLRKALPIKLHHWELEQEHPQESNHPSTPISDNAVTAAMINHALGEITEEMGHVYDAIPFFEKAMEYYTLGYGTREHMAVAQTLHGLGDLLLQLEVKKEALACFEQAYQLYSLFRGKYHLANMDVLAGKSLVLRMMGRLQEALFVLQFVYEVYSYELGEEDAHTMAVQAEMATLREEISHPLLQDNEIAPNTPLKGQNLSLSTSFGQENAPKCVTSAFAGAIITGGGSFSKEYEYCRSLASSTEEIVHCQSDDNNKKLSISTASVSNSPVKSPLFLYHMTSISSTSSPLPKTTSPRRALQTSGQQVITVQPPAISKSS